MKIKNFVVNPLQENTFVVFDDTKECIVIDCGCYSDGEKLQLKNFINENDLTIKHVVNTHLHFDHILGNKFLYDNYGVKPEASAADEVLLQNFSAQLLMWNFEDEETVPLCGYLKEGDKISAGLFSFTVIEIPGHSPGGVVFYCKEENLAFVGDSIFKMSIGRTDFAGCSEEQLIDALHSKILSLPLQTILMPGHGSYTSVDFERQHNPYLI